jgi:hypothetical protein
MVQGAMDFLLLKVHDFATYPPGRGKISSAGCIAN